MGYSTEEEKKFWYQRFTLQGRMFYPEILEPKAGTNGRMKFSLLFACKYNENQAEMQRINAFLQQAKTKYHPQIPTQFWNSPVKRFDTYQRTDGRPNHEFLRDCYFINASTGADMPPVVVGMTRQPVLDKAEIYSGRNVAVSFTFWLNNGGKDGTGKKGVGANLNGVMLLEGGAKEGGSSQGNIDEIFGAFASEMAVPPQYSQPHLPPQQPPQQPWTPQAPAQNWPPQAPAQNWPPTNNNGNNNGSGGSFY